MQSPRPLLPLQLLVLYFTGQKKWSRAAFRFLILRAGFGMMKKRHNAGFTLTELLVVMAIIIVLIALLMPAWGNLKDRGRTIQCLGHQRQLGLAVSAYTADKNKAGTSLKNQQLILPKRFGGYGGAYAWWDWKTFLWRGEYVGHPDVFYCSEYSRQRVATTRGENNVLPYKDLNSPISLGWNDMLSHNGGHGQMGTNPQNAFATKHYKQPGSKNPTPYQDVQNTPVILCASAYTVWKWRTKGGHAFHPEMRHRGKTKIGVVWLDGHVSLITSNECEALFMFRD